MWYFKTLGWKISHIIFLEKRGRKTEGKEVHGLCSKACVGRSIWLARWVTHLFLKSKNSDFLFLFFVEGLYFYFCFESFFNFINSPGFTAAYCSYSVQDLDSKKIVGLYVAEKKMVWKICRGLKSKLHVYSGELQWRNGTVLREDSAASPDTWDGPTGGLHHYWQVYNHA